MMRDNSSLQVLLVEDDPSDMKMYLRDFPAIFEKCKVQATFHCAQTFEEAMQLIRDGSRRYDLILSDTYKGEARRDDAIVIDMVNEYRGDRFCPLVVFSASAQPEKLQLGAFVVWADKSERNGIEKAIERMLSTGIPQAARSLHNDLDRVAGSYLWGFLEKYWDRLQQGGQVQGELLGRLIKRRAALQLAEIESTEGGTQRVADVHGLELYMYPPINPNQYSLGEVIRGKADKSDIRVIMTPHCYLTVQPGQTDPRAEFVQTLKTIAVKQVLGAEKVKNAKTLKSQDQDKKLRKWSAVPSGQEVGRPEGRYWYLPAFLDIPHLYCDFMQVESLPYKNLRDDFDSIATLSPPYAESLQACYGSFYGSVGIPGVRPSSIADLLD